MGIVPLLGTAAADSLEPGMCQSHPMGEGREDSLLFSVLPCHGDRKEVAHVSKYFSDKNIFLFLLKVLFSLLSIGLRFESGWGLSCKEKAIMVPQRDSFTGWAQSQSSTWVVLYTMGSSLVHKTRQVRKIKIYCRGCRGRP